jgi:predicted PurR-regulated permease PerM
LLFTLFVTAMLVLLMLLEGTKLKNGFLKQLEPKRAAQVSRIASEVHSSVTGYMLGNFITSLIAGLVVLVTLEILGVPFPLLWAVWVALVDFLPMIGGILAGVPTVLFAMTHSLGAGVAVAIVFIVYTQVENHVLNPIVMSKTVRINPLLVLIAILVGASLGDLVGGVFGGFVGTLLAIPFAGSITVLIREAWSASDTHPALGAAIEGTTQVAGGVDEQ